LYISTVYWDFTEKYCSFNTVALSVL